MRYLIPVIVFLRTVFRFGPIQALKLHFLSRLTSDEITIRGSGYGPITIRGKTSDAWVLTQLLVNEEYAALMHGSPRKIIDAGANIGLAAIFFARRFPDAQIVSIEPDHDNFRLLTANTAHLENVTAIEGALWHRCENLEFINAGDEKYALAVVASDQGRITGITVDALLARQGWEFVDLLKMDIEGGESQVLSAAEDWVDRVASMIVELHQDVAPQAAKHLFSCFRDRDIWLGWRGENLIIRNRSALH